MPPGHDPRPKIVFLKNGLFKVNGNPFRYPSAAIGHSRGKMQYLGAARRVTRSSDPAMANVVSTVTSLLAPGRRAESGNGRDSAAADVATSDPNRILCRGVNEACEVGGTGACYWSRLWSCSESRLAFGSSELVPTHGPQSILPSFDAAAPSDHSIARTATNTNNTNTTRLTTSPSLYVAFRICQRSTNGDLS